MMCRPERHVLSRLLAALLLLLWLAVVLKQQSEVHTTECSLLSMNDKDECRCCSFLRLTKTFDDSMNKNIVFIKTPKAASSTFAGIARRIGAHRSFLGVRIKNVHMFELFNSAKFADGRDRFEPFVVGNHITRKELSLLDATRLDLPFFS